MSDFTSRKQSIMRMAAGTEAEPLVIPYEPLEHSVWQTVSTTLAPIWETHVVPELLIAREALDLPTDRIPQLFEVSQKLASLSAFTYRAINGLSERDQFFAGLATNRFFSTQYIRSPEHPFYTEEPDVIHEVLGHGTLLADPDLAQLHRLAGSALMRAETEEARRFIANVWWFSGEFGVINKREGAQAYGAGLLSSVSELSNMNSASISPLDISAMGLAHYEIDRLQPRLFAAQSLAHVMDHVGGFFEHADDDLIVRMRGVL